MPDSVTDGKTPVLETGTTTTLSPTESATSEVVRNGEDSNGNPRYKINLGIPKGKDGTGGSGGGTAGSVDWSDVQNKPSWVKSNTKPSYTASEVGALPLGTVIPSKTSQLTNDSEFVKGAGLKTINGQSIVGSGNIFIQSGSGEGGAGNVSVYNADRLRAGGKYVFTPSADGVSEGSFNELNMADRNNPGLMGANDYVKLITLKGVISLPVIITGLSESSSSENIISSFAYEGSVSDDTIAYLAAAYSNIQSSGYEATIPDLYIGNYRCYVDSSFETDKCSLALTYVVSGKLRTISINGTMNENVWTYSCKVIESGDDTYYLSKPDSYTATDCFTAFGGDEGRAKIALAVGQRKKFYIMYGSGVLGGSIPVTVESGFNFPVLIWTYPILEKTCRFKMMSEDSSELRVLNLYYYQLNSGFYSLTSSSTTDEISVAVGREAGLKDIVQAVKDGNRIRINTALSPYDVSTELLPWAAGISKEGNIHLGVYGKGYGLFNSAGGLLVIDYTKTTNTFKAELLDI